MMYTWNDLAHILAVQGKPLSGPAIQMIMLPAKAQASEIDRLVRVELAQAAGEETEG